MVALTLPRLHWGPTDAPHRALLVHGLGSSAQTMWFLGEYVASKGWSATAVDLRGHGDAPRASSYRIADFAEDLAHTHPDSAASWDLVAGHSIAGAAVVSASAHNPQWTKKLVLLDPALYVVRDNQEAVLARQRYGHDQLTEDEVRAQFPHWHPQDQELRVVANRQASRFALEHAVIDNAVWDVRDDAAALAVPTLILRSDPAVDTMAPVALMEEVCSTNPLISHEMIEGAGHSLHRDRPQQTAEALFRWLG